jgi:hypothetical protein
MRKAKVIISFKNQSVPELIGFARNIVIKMTGNTSFPTPDVALTLITTAATTLETKYNAAQSGGKQQTADMHQARTALEDLLHKEGLYVERIALGNDTMILSSGYDVSKQPDPALHPEFTVMNGDKEGEVILKHKAVAGAKAWVWQYCPDPIGSVPWIWIEASTQATYTVTGFKPGTKYWFRAAHVIPDGMSDWCDPLAQIVT